MADLLLELFSEEIPARMQARAEADFAKLITDALSGFGLSAQSVETFSGPRRLAMLAHGLPAQSTAITEERKGPRVGAPEKAVEGFLRGAGLKSIADCEVVKDAKGDYYIARTEKPGRTVPDILSEIVPEVVAKFSWPKSMRWGSGKLRWVRPLHSILCLFDDKPVKFEIDGVKSGAITYGHRFESGENATQPNCIELKHSKDYTDSLLQCRVVSARDRRARIILDGAHKVAREAGLALVEDHGLLEENAGLVEWPVVLSGQFHQDFLDVPEEILMTSMKAHQKCFSLRDSKSKKLANHFILIANLEADDGGKAIVAGNERVIRARLSDAKFFWQNDKAKPLADLAARLGNVTFHEKLGTQLKRVARVVTLAQEIAKTIKADQTLTKQAAELCKADLMSETVGEFPELQGVIGRYLAKTQGLNAAVADAMADHYKPQGPADAVPTDPVSIAVALADKLDVLTGFWAIDEKPTGSKDPFALRRAALGVIRIILENEVRLGLSLLLKTYKTGVGQALDEEALASLLSFFADRLKVYLRDQGARHDLIDAVYALPGQDDLLMIVRRVEALGRFLDSEDGKSLLALVRRALNILKIEEKKEGRAFEGKADAKHMSDAHEKDLNAAITAVTKDVGQALKKEDFEAAMASLAKLRVPVDTFFDKVTVNADDRHVRENRLKLLNGIRELTLHIADFGKIEG